MHKNTPFIAISLLMVYLIPVIVLAANTDNHSPAHASKKAESPGSNHKQVATAPAPHHEIHWGYSGAGGPHVWGELLEEYSTCKTGKFQSPIDISSVTIGPMPNIRLKYKSSTVRVINNGHTIKIEYDAGSTIQVSGKSYQLLQFHFHSPSEHTIGGKAYPMVAHLVHQASDGQLGVLGVLFIEGRENVFLNQFWKSLPQNHGDKFVDRKTKINMKNLLPRKLQYFNYIGSLTTPPCSEGVNWMVLSHPVEASRQQFDKFLALFPQSVRPVEPLNGRVVILKN